MRHAHKCINHIYEKSKLERRGSKGYLLLIPSRILGPAFLNSWRILKELCRQPEYAHSQLSSLEVTNADACF